MSHGTLTELRPAAFDPYQSYRKTLLSPSRVRELSTLNPARGSQTRSSAGRGYSRLGRWWPYIHLWTVLLAIPVVGTRFYALLIIGHDGIHRRLFRHPRWNDWFADLFIFGPVAQSRGLIIKTTWATIATWRLQMIPICTSSPVRTSITGIC